MFSMTLNSSSDLGHRRQHYFDDQPVRRHSGHVREDFPGVTDITAHEAFYQSEDDRFRGGPASILRLRDQQRQLAPDRPDRLSQFVALGRFDQPLNGDDPTVQNHPEGVMAGTACREGPGIAARLLMQTEKRRWR